MTDDSRSTTEQALIGCMLLSATAIDALIEAGGGYEWFLGAESRKVARCILTRYEEGKKADDWLIINEQGIVSSQWLSDCMELVPTVSEAGDYIRVIKGYVDKDALVALHGAIGGIVANCTPETVQEATAAIEAAVAASLRKGTTEAGTMREAGHSLIDRQTAPDAVTTLLDWPVRAITDMVGRISRDVIWICAQPSAGKTAFVLQMARLLAAQGRKIAIASMESDVESIAGRLIASSAPMSMTSIRQGRATDEEIAKARAAADTLSDNIMVTGGSMSIDVACSWGKAQVRAGAQMLIYDNARHVSVGNANGRVDEMAIMSSRFKQLRDQCEVPVLILHHSKIDDGTESVAWSSDVLKDCDLLVFLRPDDEKKDMVRFNLKKNREGPSNLCELLRFDKDIQRFERWVDEPFITKDEDVFSSGQKLFDNE